MSRAFVTDKEDWIYCTKAGERCMHAEPGKHCSRKSCEHFNKEAQTIDKDSIGLRIVSKRRKMPLQKQMNQVIAGQR